MRIKNITKTRTFNLESGKCKPGECADAVFPEAKMLLGQGFAKAVSQEAPKPLAKTPDKSNKPIARGLS